MLCIPASASYFPNGDTYSRLHEIEGIFRSHHGGIRGVKVASDESVLLLDDDNPAASALVDIRIIYYCTSARSNS